MERINLNSFIISLYNKFKDTEFGCGIEDALKEQGLSIINNEIKSAPKFRIEKGKWYMCIDDCRDDTDETLYYKKGKIYYCHENNKLTNELGNPIHYWFDDDEPWLSFRPATDEEVYLQMGRNDEYKPKFKQFDWVIDYLCMRHGQIISIDEKAKTYKIQFSDDSIMDVLCPFADKELRLWCTDDIKSGDIITYNCCDNKTIALVKSIDDDRIYYHIWSEPDKYMYEKCGDVLRPWSNKKEIFESGHVYPANMEERKHLLGLIDEIGYSFNSKENVLEKKKGKDYEIPVSESNTVNQTEITTCATSDIPEFLTNSEWSKNKMYKEVNEKGEELYPSWWNREEKNAFIEGALWNGENVVNKICQWLTENAHNYIDELGYNSNKLADQLKETFLS